VGVASQGVGGGRLQCVLMQRVCACVCVLLRSVSGEQQASTKYQLPSTINPSTGTHPHPHPHPHPLPQSQAHQRRRSLVILIVILVIASGTYSRGQANRAANERCYIFYQGIY